MKTGHERVAEIEPILSLSEERQAFNSFGAREAEQKYPINNELTNGEDEKTAKRAVDRQEGKHWNLNPQFYIALAHSSLRTKSKLFSALLWQQGFRTMLSPMSFICRLRRRNHGMDVKHTHAGLRKGRPITL